MALDLLGDPISERTDIDPQHGFSEFWSSYPSGPRRVAKPQCLAKWIRYGCAKNADHIIAHVHHMKTEDCWVRGFHPMCLTYLNQQRWIDWEPVAVVAKPKICPALQKTYDDDKKAVKPSSEIRARLKQLAERRVA